MWGKKGHTGASNHQKVNIVFLPCYEFRPSGENICLSINQSIRSINQQSIKTLIICMYVKRSGNIWSDYHVTHPSFLLQKQLVLNVIIVQTLEKATIHKHLHT